MEDGLIVSAAPLLLSTCMKIIRTLHDVRPRLRPAPLTITSITIECFGLHEALAQVQELDLATLEAAKDGQSEQIVQSITAFFLGCTTTISVVDEYSTDLHDALGPVDPGVRTSTQELQFRQLWKEDDMKELLSQIKEYRSKLTNLLQTIDL